MKVVTILFLRRGDQILLAMKKRGFGADMWNGVGGKLEPGETVTAAAVRECQEEIGVTPLDPTLVGTLQFFDPTDPNFHHNSHIFVAASWEGDPRETEEMEPQWFATTDIPYDQMWPADELWLPLLLAGKHFEGTIHLTEDTLTSHDIRQVVTATAKE